MAVSGQHGVTGYAVEQLRAGWYQSFTILISPPSPAGMGYVQTIRLSDDYFPRPSERACTACPTWDTLRAFVQAKPGSLWLIGNEPDRIAVQDGVQPATYARLYHDFYVFLKTLDPSSQVGVGGIVQPTPLRLRYLDLILAAYQGTFGGAMPVDVWNTHNYLLREVRLATCVDNCWGADIPPGVPDDTGILYEIDDHDLLDPSPTDPSRIGWKQQVVNLRRWMADNGYRDRPLIISEYGILMPLGYGFTHARVRDFMLATFDWMRTATDPQNGMPADGHRLVQAWAWYSLDDKYFSPWDVTESYLFDPDSGMISPLGLDFASYTATLTSPAVDVQIRRMWHTRPQAQGGGATVTVNIEVMNQGSATAPDVQLRLERDGTQAGWINVGSLPGGTTKTVSIPWNGLTWGARHVATATADPDRLLTECDVSNNVRVLPVLVAPHRLYLPTGTRRW